MPISFWRFCISIWRNGKKHRRNLHFLDLRFLLITHSLKADTVSPNSKYTSPKRFLASILFLGGMGKSTEGTCKMQSDWYQQYHHAALFKGSWAIKAPDCIFWSSGWWYLILPGWSGSYQYNHPRYSFWILDSYWSPTRNVYVKPFLQWWFGKSHGKGFIRSNYQPAAEFEIPAFSSSGTSPVLSNTMIRQHMQYLHLFYHQTASQALPWHLCGSCISFLYTAPIFL